MVKTLGYNYTYTILIAKLVNITWFSCLVFLLITDFSKVKINDHF